jgi:hypothetical protein
MCAGIVSEMGAHTVLSIESSKDRRLVAVKRECFAFAGYQVSILRSSRPLLSNYADWAVPEAFGIESNSM